MSKKQTDRSQIQSYQKVAIGHFEDIRDQLGGLMESVAAADYEGQNALEFKTGCVDHATTFGADCVQALQQIADLVSERSSAIARALGGDSISINIGGLTAPARADIRSDVNVETADEAALSGLHKTVGAHFTSIDGYFNDHYLAFAKLGDPAIGGWLGPEFEQTREDLGTATKKIQGMVTDNKATIQGYINDQLVALGFTPAG